MWNDSSRTRVAEKRSYYLIPMATVTLKATYCYAFVVSSLTMHLSLARTIGIEAGKGSVGTRDRKEGHTIDGVAGRPLVCCLCSLVLVSIYYLIIGGFTLHKHYSRSSRARPFRGCALLGRARIGLATKQSQHYRPTFPQACM